MRLLRWIKRKLFKKEYRIDPEIRSQCFAPIDEALIKDQFLEGGIVPEESTPDDCVIHMDPAEFSPNYYLEMHAKLVTQLEKIEELEKELHDWKFEYMRLMREGVKLEGKDVK